MGNVILKRRIRALWLVAVGLLVAAAPLLIAPQPASAADNQPYTEMAASLNGPEPCHENVDIELTISYKDKNGVVRQTTADAGTFSLRLTAYGTYSAINVTAKAHYYDCDPNRSAACNLSVGVSPK